MNKEHPEVTEIQNICNISHHTPYTQEICEKMKVDAKKTKRKVAKARLKEEDKLLDKKLKGTFPASDATAEY